ncbi:MAG: hypothetical protein COB66_00430 [Coxiella sp. (in: Bacteria)]|nr:MAG: hypothetical protein COB66_00430 [Coxiella sp. (in: g-proteobacteria)]
MRSGLLKRLNEWLIHNGGPSDTYEGRDHKIILPHFLLDALDALFKLDDLRGESAEWDDGSLASLRRLHLFFHYLILEHKFDDKEHEDALYDRRVPRQFLTIEVESSTGERSALEPTLTFTEESLEGQQLSYNIYTPLGQLNSMAERYLSAFDTLAESTNNHQGVTLLLIRLNAWLEKKYPNAEYVESLDVLHMPAFLYNGLQRLGEEGLSFLNLQLLGNAVVDRVLRYFRHANNSVCLNFTLDEAARARLRSRSILVDKAPIHNQAKIDVCLQRWAQNLGTITQLNYGYRRKESDILHALIRALVAVEGDISHVDVMNILFTKLLHADFMALKDPNARPPAMTYAISEELQDLEYNPRSTYSKHEFNVVLKRLYAYFNALTQHITAESIKAEPNVYGEVDPNSVMGHVANQVMAQFASVTDAQESTLGFLPKYFLDNISNYGSLAMRAITARDPHVAQSEGAEVIQLCPDGFALATQQMMTNRVVTGAVANLTPAQDRRSKLTATLIEEQPLSRWQSMTYNWDQLSMKKKAAVITAAMVGAVSIGVVAYFVPPIAWLLAKGMVILTAKLIAALAVTAVVVGGAALVTKKLAKPVVLETKTEHLTFFSATPRSSPTASPETERRHLMLPGPCDLTV